MYLFLTVSELSRDFPWRFLKYFLSPGQFFLSFGEKNLTELLELYAKCPDDQFGKKLFSWCMLNFYHLEFEPKVLNKCWKFINRLTTTSFYRSEKLLRKHSCREDSKVFVDMFWLWAKTHPNFSEINIGKFVKAVF